MRHTLLVLARSCPRQERASYAARAGVTYSVTGAVESEASLLLARCTPQGVGAAQDTAGAGAMYSTSRASAAYIASAPKVPVATGTAAMANELPM